MFTTLISLIVTFLYPDNHERLIVHEDLITTVNSMKTSWTAGLNTGSSVDGATKKQAQALCGVKKGGPLLPPKQFHALDKALPTHFNSIVRWPQCATMKMIRDQSACGSCWAFAAVEAMSDRSCIFLNKNMSLSAADMAFCCSGCGFGCGGGFPSAAWQYYTSTGVVEEGCWPYPFPSCDHHIPHSKHPCPSQEYNNPNCPSQCVPKWNGPTWNNGLHFGSSYSLSGVSAMQQEIYTNGPVEATFSVYEDFLTYKAGVYKHVTGSYLGGHAVKILGWGVERNVPYWLVANSWNPNWGDKGFFKILRGQDECGIEDSISAGIPKS
jgi:cathepsin B